MKGCWKATGLYGLLSSLCRQILGFFFFFSSSRPFHLCVALCKTHQATIPPSSWWEKQKSHLFYWEIIWLFFFLRITVTFLNSSLLNRPNTSSAQEDVRADTRQNHQIALRKCIGLSWQFRTPWNTLFTLAVDFKAEICSMKTDMSKKALLSLNLKGQRCKITAERCSFWLPALS